MLGGCRPVALALALTWSVAPRMALGQVNFGSQDAPEVDAVSLRLLDAAMLGDLAEAREAIAGKANVEARSGAHMTALGVAAIYGHADIVRLLLQSGADVAADQDGETPLMVAAREGHADVVEVLIGSGAKVDAADSEGMTAVMAAAAANRAAVVKVLAGNGADVNTVSGQGATALIAAAYSGHIEAVRALIEAGAEVNTKGGSSRTALMAAALGGSTAVARVLLDAKIDLTAEDSSGSNALLYAAANGHLDFVDLMLKAGLTKDIDLALALSVRGCHVESAERLMGAGAKTTANLNGTPLIVLAASANCSRGIELLLAHGASIDARDDNGTTALMHSAGLGLIDVVRLLLDKGADAELVNNDKRSAFQLAAMASQRDVLQVLSVGQKTDGQKKP